MRWNSLRNIAVDKHDDGDDDKDRETEGVAMYAKAAEQIEVENRRGTGEMKFEHNAVSVIYG
jgi:hypothetical protein